jgi:hypothetical protein
MSWKTFIQVIVLIFIAGAILYLTSPRYQISVYNGNLMKANKITGKVLAFSPGVDAQGKPTKMRRGWLVIQ